MSPYHGIQEILQIFYATLIMLDKRQWPEKYSYEDKDETIDIWSLELVFHSLLLIGEVPFQDLVDMDTLLTRGSNRVGTQTFENNLDCKANTHLMLPCSRHWQFDL
jgi:hypothetical protein